MSESIPEINFSHVPCNVFTINKEWRFTDPISQVADRLFKDGEELPLARVDLMLPLGCPFSLFVVAGHDADGCPHACIVVNRELAGRLMAAMEDGRIYEMPLHLFNHLAGMREDEPGGPR